MEITTKEWGMIGDDCTKLLNFRLFADGRLEYEICQHKNLAAGRAVSSPLRKELRITEKQVDAFKQYVERSGFMDAQPRYYSGRNLVDIGADTAIIYRKESNEKTVSVKNYVPDSKQISKSIHQVLQKAAELLPKAD